MVETRGERFMNHSQCKYCECKTKTDHLIGHRTEQGNLFLKGQCEKCHHVKKLPYTEDQLAVEGEGIKRFFVNVYNKAIKPVVKKVAKNPGKALDIIAKFGEAYVSKDPIRAANTLSESIKYLKTGQGVYLYKKPGGNIMISVDEKKKILGK